MKDPIALLFICIAFVVSGYAHEQDLIRQCKETGVAKIWNGDYEMSCKVKKLK